MPVIAGLILLQRELERDLPSLVLSRAVFT